MIKSLFVDEDEQPAKKSITEAQKQAPLPQADEFVDVAPTWKEMQINRLEGRINRITLKIIQLTQKGADKETLRKLNNDLIVKRAQLEQLLDSEGK